MAQIIGSKGEELDFLIRQGGTFGPFRVTLKNPDGSSVILTDTVFRGQIRKTPSSLNVEASFIFRTINAFGGVFEFEIDAASTAAIMAGLTEELPESAYVYDIEYANEENRVLPLFYGKVKVFREVTKS